MAQKHVRSEGHHLRIIYVFILENDLLPGTAVRVRPNGFPGATGIVARFADVVWGELSRHDEGILSYTEEQMDMFDPVVLWTIGGIARLCPLEPFSSDEDWCIHLTNDEMTLKFANEQALEDCAPHVEWLLSEMIGYLKRHAFIANT